MTIPDDTLCDLCGRSVRQILDEDQTIQVGRIVYDADRDQFLFLCGMEKA
jgi:hypothetical protein